MSWPPDWLGKLSRTQQRRLRWALVLLAAVLVLSLALGTRLSMVANIRYPGHSDHAFYLSVAQNLVEGRGLVVDYIWNFLSDPTALTHSSTDYWMPAASILMAPGLRLFGNSVVSALIPSLVFGVGLGLITYLMAKALSLSEAVALCSAGLVLFSPPAFTYSLLTDSTIYFAVFAATSLVLIMRGMTRPGFFLATGVVIALAQLTRQDGVLLLPALAIAVFLSPLAPGKKGIYFLGSLLLYLVALSPLLAYNYREFHSLFPVGPSKTMFLTTYEDLYSYGKELTLKTYLQWGWRNILDSKVEAGISYLTNVWGGLGPPLSVLLLVGVIERLVRRRSKANWRIHAPWLAYAGLLFGFYAIVATFPGMNGGFARSMVALIPVLVLVSVDSAERLIPSKPVFLLLTVGIGIWLMQSAHEEARHALAENTRVGEAMASLGQVMEGLQRAGQKGEMVVMTRDPWELTYQTGLRSVEIPNNGLDVILQVAHQFGANYLVLPAPREALAGLYEGTRSFPAFQLVGTVPNTDLKLYRIISP